MKRTLLALIAVLAGVALTACDGGGGGPMGTELAARDYTCPAGESAPCMTTEPDDPAGRTVVLPNDISPAGEFTYIMNLVQIPVASGGAAVGFNLDGLDSGEGSTEVGAACNLVRPDYRSSTDSGHIGTDNQLQALRSLLEAATSGDLDETLATQLAEGSVLLGMRVSGVDSLTHDDNVTVQLLLGSSGQVPTLDSNDRIEAGQTFEGMAIGAPVTGDILDGRLAVTGASQFALSLDISGTMVELVIRNPRIRFDIGTGSLTNAAIGGVLLVEDVVNLAENIMPGFGEMVRTILQDNYADVQPSSADPEVCDAISVGLAFEAVPATFNTP